MLVFLEHALGCLHSSSADILISRALSTHGTSPQPPYLAKEKLHGNHLVLGYSV